MARTVASHLAEQASPLRKVKITSKVPRKLPKLAARRPEGVIEKVMPSASNVEKVGIPLPKVKEKVEKRGKYLKAVVDSLVALGQGGKVRSYGGIVARMQIDLPWDNKRVGLALKAGVEEGVLDGFSFKDWHTGNRSIYYMLSRSRSVSFGGGKKRLDAGAGTGDGVPVEVDLLSMPQPHADPPPAPKSESAVSSAANQGSSDEMGIVNENDLSDLLDSSLTYDSSDEHNLEMYSDPGVFDLAEHTKKVLKASRAGRSVKKEKKKKRDYLREKEEKRKNWAVGTRKITDFFRVSN